MSMGQTGRLKAVAAREIAGGHFRYYDFVMAAFVAIILLSNVLGAGKVAVVNLPGIGLWPFGAGILFFPISYVIGDVLTEVYGYARARRVIWVGSVAVLFMAFMSWVVVALPPAPEWKNQAAYETVFGQVPRIVFASLAAFWVGEFVNSYVLARMKIWTNGRMLWTRTIGSTIAGQGVDSLIFYPLAFLGASGWTNELVFKVLVTQWVLKVSWEVLLTPFTYLRRQLPQAARRRRRVRRGNRLHALQGQCVSTLQHAKLWLVGHTGLAKDALHIHVALILFFGVALVLGWKLSSWRPWLVVLAAALLCEAWDIRDRIADGVRLNLWGDWHDIWNTMFWPTMILLLARHTRVLRR